MNKHSIQFYLENNKGYEVQQIENTVQENNDNYDACCDIKREKDKNE